MTITEVKPGATTTHLRIEWVVVVSRLVRGRRVWVEVPIDPEPNAAVPKVLTVPIRSGR